MKVERVSYDVITPSAARAVFESVFWKPAVRWLVKKIEVIAPIRWISVRRNEVGCVMGEKPDGIFIEEHRQQRAGLFLRDVHYRLHAELDFIPPGLRRASYNHESDWFADEREWGEFRKDENPAKYNAIFDRRARKGQCFHRPYLGCREFGCHFRMEEDPAAAAKKNPPIAESRDLGFILYDIDFSQPNDLKSAFFRAKLENGVVTVPPWDSEEVRR